MRPSSCSMPAAPRQTCGGNCPPDRRRNPGGGTADGRSGGRRAGRQRPRPSAGPGRRARRRTQGRGPPRAPRDPSYPPVGGEALEWLLLTTAPVETALRVPRPEGRGPVAPEHPGPLVPRPAGPGRPGPAGSVAARAWRLGTASRRSRSPQRRGRGGVAAVARWRRTGTVIGVASAGRSQSAAPDVCRRPPVRARTAPAAPLPAPAPSPLRPAGYAADRRRRLPADFQRRRGRPSSEPRREFSESQAPGAPARGCAGSPAETIESESSVRLLGAGARGSAANARGTLDTLPSPRRRCRLARPDEIRCAQSRAAAPPGPGCRSDPTERRGPTLGARQYHPNFRSDRRTKDRLGGPTRSATRRLGRPQTRSSFGRGGRRPRASESGSLTPGRPTGGHISPASRTRRRVSCRRGGRSAARNEGSDSTRPCEGRLGDHGSPIPPHPSRPGLQARPLPRARHLRLVRRFFGSQAVSRTAWEIADRTQTMA